MRDRPGVDDRAGGLKLVELVNDGDVSTVAVDQILTGVGRVPAVQDLQLEAAGVSYDVDAGIRVDDFLRTTNPRIYAAGDVCLEHKFTDTADASARIVVQNAPSPLRSPPTPISSRRGLKRCCEGRSPAN